MADAELALRARGGDELAFRRLVDRCEDVIEFHIRKYFGAGLARDDFRQEALVGLHKAARDYRPERGKTFRGFASLCIERQVITALRTARRNKHMPLNDATPFSAPVGESEDLELGDILPDSRPTPPEAMEIAENLADVMAIVREDLSPLERDVLIHVAEGRRYDEITALTGRHLKAVDNALQRARRKIAGRPQPRSACRPRRHRPTNERKQPMSIIQSIDAEITGVEEEIASLEEQLGPKRMRLENLKGLREQAERLDSDETAPLPEPVPISPPPKIRSARRKPAALPPDDALSQVAREALTVVNAAKEGIRSGQIRTEAGMTHGQVRRATQELVSLGLIEMRGERAAARYFPKGATARPKQAPTREQHTPAPALPPSPPAKPAPRPLSPAREAHQAMRSRVRTAILDLVADSAPVTREEIVTMVLEQVPEADRSDVNQERMKLAGGRNSDGKRKIEERSGGFYLARGIDTPPGPITRPEKEAVACLGSGRTAREVAANVESIRDETAARQILQGLVRRGVIASRPGPHPKVYEALEEVAAAA